MNDVQTETHSMNSTLIDIIKAFLVTRKRVCACVWACYRERDGQVHIVQLIPWIVYCVSEKCCCYTRCPNLLVLSSHRIYGLSIKWFFIYSTISLSHIMCLFKDFRFWAPKPEDRKSKNFNEALNLVFTTHENHEREIFGIYVVSRFLSGRVFVVLLNTHSLSSCRVWSINTFVHWKSILFINFDLFLRTYKSKAVDIMEHWERKRWKTMWNKARERKAKNCFSLSIQCCHKRMRLFQYLVVRKSPPWPSTHHHHLFAEIARSILF